MKAHSEKKQEHKKMKLIIIRHGETNHNKERICQGQLDTDLSIEGIEQAKKLGKRFKETKINFCYSSDLKRAKNTAKEILKYHEDIKLILDKRIRERNFGKLQEVLSLNILIGITYQKQ